MRLSQKYCQPEFTEGYQIDCQYFDNPDGYRDNMTINSTFKTASLTKFPVKERNVFGREDHFFAFSRFLNTTPLSLPQISG